MQKRSFTTISSSASITKMVFAKMEGVNVLASIPTDLLDVLESDKASLLLI
ncbi:hypothetical protein Gohar_020260, partial [Gossypium harknessii]|nr:hypothetical protein [Gossypium harknessii]